MTATTRGRKTKESWEMTAREYLDSPYTDGYAKSEKRFIASFSGKQYPANQVAIALKQVQTRGEIPNHGHWFDINKALSEGKPVPLEVLEDYPDLQAKSLSVIPFLLVDAPRKPKRRLSKRARSRRRRPDTTIKSMRR